MGDYAAKKGRASWRGKIVGWYRTDLTALGYAIESHFEPGSVQIYPETAIEPWIPPHAVEKPLLYVPTQEPNDRFPPGKDIRGK
jgi:dihydrofolate reductase (trimethoprim resistance protein)